MRERSIVLAMLCLLLAASAAAGPLRERIAERRAAGGMNASAEDGDGAALLPPDIRIIRDVAYGKDPRQRFDVYAPPQAKKAPVIFMVHGGGWSRGDKAMAAAIENKLAHWLPLGFIVVSTNYRMLPDADPQEQVRDVARAIATAQEEAHRWGGERRRFLLMGHSAGAHLVALLHAAPRLSPVPLAPWQGSVLLDSGALDVPQIMESRHLRLYDAPFGKASAYWRAVSPLHQLQAGGAPILAVCSSRRADACPQAEKFSARANALGLRASVLRQDLSHREINQRLGEAGPYTEAVDAFLRSLDLLPGMKRDQ